MPMSDAEKLGRLRELYDPTRARRLGLKDVNLDSPASVMNWLDYEMIRTARTREILGIEDADRSDLA
jgi:hypothetical protein